MVIVELNIPKMIVGISDKFLSSKVNLNYFIKFTMSLSEESADPEQIKYSAAIIYKFEVVGTQIFRFEDFRLKLWEIYD